MNDLLKNLKKISASSSRNRNELDRELKKAKKVYDKSKTEYERSKSIVEESEQKRDLAHQQMIEARKEIIDISNYTRNMDLVGATDVKNRDDTETYYINGKEYHVDISDVNDIKCTPWKEYKNKKSEEPEPSDDSNDVEDELVEEEDDFEKYFSDNHRFSSTIAQAVHTLKYGK